MFQLTRPRGTRLRDFVNLRARNVFQLTRPRGTRHTTSGSETKIFSFNSRVRGGRDVAREREKVVALVSTHASAGDATSYVLRHRLRLRFNSRVRGGRDVFV